MQITSFVAVAAACVGTSQAFVAPSQASCSQMTMSAAPVNRASFLKNAAVVATAVTVASPVLAEVDNPIVPFLGGSDKIDLNNANVRAYIRLPGMYPTAAGKIVSNGPYAKVEDVYNIKNLSAAEKAAIKKYEGKFVINEPQAMYTIDRINNGLYR